MENFISVNFTGPRHPAVVTYPLMDSPYKTVMFSVAYLLVVLYAGPAWMKNRKPFQLRTTMAVYNLSLTAINVYVFLGFGFNGWFTNYKWRCEPVDYSNSETSQRLVFIAWMFYVTKLLEYLDTVFFVLRKKDKQISFLHIVHHSTMPVTTWLGVNLEPGGSCSICMIVNSFVHIWMYLYYGLSGMGPSVQKYLWWKKYITVLQLTQFVTITMYMSLLYFFPLPNCHHYDLPLLLPIVEAIIFFVLFAQFYIQTYLTPRQAIKKYENGSSTNGSVNGSNKKEY